MDSSSNLNTESNTESEQVVSIVQKFFDRLKLPFDKKSLYFIMILALITTTTETKLNNIINQFSKINHEDANVLHKVVQHPKLWTKVANKLVVWMAYTLSYSSFAMLLNKIHQFFTKNNSETIKLKTPDIKLIESKSPEFNPPESKSPELKTIPILLAEKNYKRYQVNYLPWTQDYQTIYKCIIFNHTVNPNIFYNQSQNNIFNNQSQNNIFNNQIQNIDEYECIIIICDENFVDEISKRDNIKTQYNIKLYTLSAQNLVAFVLTKKTCSFKSKLNVLF